MKAKLPPCPVWICERECASVACAPVDPLAIFAPAKINLFLAVTGRRADGFHDLVSVVSQLGFGDTLGIEPAGGFSLTCDDPAVPADESNLVLRAARAFATATNWKGGAKFTLAKRIPAGAGLGGGSSDAVAALRGLNLLAGEPLDGPGLAALAAQLGSDCPLFLHAGPVVMRGRGERITALPANAAPRIRGRRVLVFKPGFGIATPWAYARLAASAPASYVPAAEAEARLAAWIHDDAAPAEALLFNSMEPPAFAKFPALPALVAELRERFGLSPRMSGSGSACFALLEERTDAAPIIAAIRAAWGASASVIETRLT
ncbi:MAG: 4-(cytidine 5'-diphospho)-2-C-methyl-D-erythritol kinase [Opitutaceae bacterium]|nr:4-(cytidine 5'-diphospho)-2-C-methyl-D-erythritol kinase [Opitutaceae bacterium]